MKNKICVIGGGYWGKNHIRTLAELGNLGGIVEKDFKVLERYSKEYPSVDCFSNLSEALKIDEFIGYTVATPAQTHFEIAKRIIKKKKHLLLEKPMTLSLSDSERLVKLSKEHSINLMVGHIMLFHPAIVKIKSLISEGAIGQLQYIYSNRLNLGQVRSEENVFWSLAPHDISIFQFLIDSFPEKISASGSSYLQKDIHDSTITIIKYPKNIEGHIFVSWLHPFKEHRLVVIGSEAMLVFEDSLEEKPLKLFSKRFDLKNGYPEKIDGPVQLIDYDMKMPLNEEIKYFVKHAISGEKLIKANAEHGLEVMKILVNASNELD